MKKIFFLLFFLLIVVFGYSQKRSEYLKDTIVWKEGNHLLIRKDFEAKPSKGSYYGMTVSGIMLDIKGDRNAIVAVVEAVFFRSNSWLKTDSAYELKHEQGHFDISEIYARRLRKKISQINFTTAKKVQSQIHDFYNQINTELQKEQDRYDRETEHSVKKEKQENWNKRITSELEELKDFTATEVKVGNK